MYIAPVPRIEEGMFVSRFSDRMFEEGGRFRETETRVAAGTLAYP